MERAHLERGSKLGELSLPVADEARGHHQEARLGEPSRELFAHEERDGLQRLSETHVVGQHAARAENPQPLKPRQSLGLVGAKRGGDPRRTHFDLLERQRVERLCPARGCATSPRDAGPSAVGDRLFETRDRTGLERLKPENAHRQTLAPIELDQDFQDLHHALGRKRDVAVLFDSHRAKPRGDATKGVETRCALVLAQQIEERGQQVHPPAIDFDAELEPEPIGLVAGVHVRVPRRIAVDDLVRVLGIDLHAEAQRAKLRNGVRGERAPRVDVAIELDQVVGL